VQPTRPDHGDDQAPEGPRLEAERALLRFLQRQGHLSAVDVVRLGQRAGRTRASVFQLLEQEGRFRQQELAEILATAMRLRIVDLRSFPFDPQVCRVLKEAVATRYEVVPLRIDDQAIEIATANPLDREALKALEFATGRRVRLSVTTQTEVREALASIYRMEESLEEFLQKIPEDETLTLAELHDDSAGLRSLTEDAELPPVVKLADMLLAEGTKNGASDIHIEPTLDGVVVRYRLDGMLEEGFRFPKWVQGALIGRIKVMARLDITERRVPQDGRIQVRFQGRAVDFRVSSLPIQLGEKITLRILDATRAVRTLDVLGFAPEDLEHIRHAARGPQGMILVTGPTGSGKTTTLYAIIREVASPTRNVVTIENPIEYQLRGINQVEVNEKQGLTFAGVLRSVLRQDPDVILVGEIRDHETAAIAFQAAQTGHLVLSTLHTNDAVASVTRLIDLGIEPFVIASSLNLVMAQRLVRRVCPSCSGADAPAPEHLKQLGLEPGEAEWRRGAGCPACRQSGYAGRVGVYEILPISPSIGSLLEANAREHRIREQARREHRRLLLDDAREKLRAGRTTVEEVLRVVQVGEGAPRCPQCTREVVDDFAICPHCGAVLQARCSGCARHLEPGWATCPYCGGRPADRAGTQESAPLVPARPRRTFHALVVDDELVVRHMVRTMLERASLGLTVLTAQDGAEALALTERELPDLVITDLKMPEMDGFELCRRLRTRQSTAHVPVLVLSGLGNEETAARAFSEGADDYVVKPFRREELVARIRRMLGRTYGPEATAAAPPATGESGS
jgi:type IV pilus assembly protein PilB